MRKSTLLKNQKSTTTISINSNGIAITVTLKTVLDNGRHFGIKTQYLKNAKMSKIFHINSRKLKNFNSFHIIISDAYKNLQDINKILDIYTEFNNIFQYEKVNLPPSLLGEYYTYEGRKVRYKEFLKKVSLINNPIKKMMSTPKQNCQDTQTKLKEDLQKIIEETETETVKTLQIKNISENEYHIEIIFENYAPLIIGINKINIDSEFTNYTVNIIDYPISFSIIHTYNYLHYENDKLGISHAKIHNWSSQINNIIDKHDYPHPEMLKVIFKSLKEISEMIKSKRESESVDEDEILELFISHIYQAVQNYIIMSSKHLYAVYYRDILVSIGSSNDKEEFIKSFNQELSSIDPLFEGLNIPLQKENIRMEEISSEKFQELRDGGELYDGISKIVSQLMLESLSLLSDMFRI